MVIAYALLDIIAVVLVGSFLLRLGLSLYQNKQAVSVFALAGGFVTYILVALTSHMASRLGYCFQMNLLGKGDLERWMRLRLALSAGYTLVSLSLLVYLALLISKDLSSKADNRKLFKESAPIWLLVIVFCFLTFVAKCN